MRCVSLSNNNTTLSNNNSTNIDDKNLINFKDAIRFKNKTGYYYVHSVYDGDTFTAEQLQEKLK